MEGVTHSAGLVSNRDPTGESHLFSARLNPANTSTSGLSGRKLDEASVVAKSADVDNHEPHQESDFGRQASERDHDPAEGLSTPSTLEKSTTNQANMRTRTQGKTGANHHVRHGKKHPNEQEHTPGEKKTSWRLTRTCVLDKPYNEQRAAFEERLRDTVIALYKAGKTDEITVHRVCTIAEEELDLPAGFLL